MIYYKTAQQERGEHRIMLKIVKRGRIASNRSVDECPLCGCRFSYTQEDVQKDSEGIVEMIKCPQCGRMIVVGRSKVIM